MSAQDMRQRIADAVADDGEDTASAEVTPSSPTAPGDGSPGGEAEGLRGRDSADTTEDAPAGDVTEVPDEYFGFKFPADLTPEERGDLIAEFKKRDDTIGKLLRERGEDDGSAEPEPEPEPEPELTDSEILQALNLDPETNPFDEGVAKIAIPLVRRQMQQEATIAQLIELQEISEIDRSWRSALEGLEKENGALPVELNHEAVMEFAAENNIGSPVDAYWRLMGPSRSALDRATKDVQAKRLQAAKAAASGTRPGTTVADDEAPVESKTAKGATREVASRLLRDLGLG